MFYLNACACGFRFSSCSRCLPPSALRLRNHLLPPAPQSKFLRLTAFKAERKRSVCAALCHTPSIITVSRLFRAECLTASDAGDCVQHGSQQRARRSRIPFGAATKQRGDHARASPPVCPRPLLLKILNPKPFYIFHTQYSLRDTLQMRRSRLRDCIT